MGNRSGKNIQRKDSFEEVQSDSESSYCSSQHNPGFADDRHSMFWKYDMIDKGLLANEVAGEFREKIPEEVTAYLTTLGTKVVDLKVLGRTWQQTSLLTLDKPVNKEWDHPTKVVLRVLIGELGCFSADIPICADSEMEAQEIARSAGISVQRFLHKGTCKIMDYDCSWYLGEYVPVKRGEWTDEQKIEYLKQLHDAKLPEKAQFIPHYSSTEDFLKYFQSICDPRHQESFSNFCKVLLEEPDLPTVLVHNDSHGKNWLAKQSDGSLFVVDWEFAAITDRRLELADDSDEAWALYEKNICKLGTKKHWRHLRFWIDFILLQHVKLQLQQGEKVLRYDIRERDFDRRNSYCLLQREKFVPVDYDILNSLK